MNPTSHDRGDVFRPITTPQFFTGDDNLDDHPARAAVAFTVWVIGFTLLAIAPATVIWTWRWFL